MKKTHSRLTAALAAIAMGILILDTKTALLGASQGLQLCVQTVIPSLFPFFLVSILLTGSILAERFALLSPLERLLRIPKGAGALILVGLLGGYPVGAQTVAQAHKDGCLSSKDTRRMLAFCSNAGPAFLFGMGARLFPDIGLCWLLWGIHVLSAWMVALLTSGGSKDSMQLSRGPAPTVTEALKKSLMLMGTVCGWVILFRLVLTFSERWFLWLLPQIPRHLFGGLLELANGCCGLVGLASLGGKLTLCSVFLGFGGLCVALQTASVASGCDGRLYLPGKLAQAAISAFLCIPAQLLLPESERWDPSGWSILMLGSIVLIYFLWTRKMERKGRGYIRK